MRHSQGHHQRSISLEGHLGGMRFDPSAVDTPESSNVGSRAPKMFERACALYNAARLSSMSEATRERQEELLETGSAQTCLATSLHGYGRNAGRRTLVEPRATDRCTLVTDGTRLPLRGRAVRADRRLVRVAARSRVSTPRHDRRERDRRRILSARDWFVRCLVPGTEPRGISFPREPDPGGNLEGELHWIVFVRHDDSGKAGGWRGRQHENPTAAA
jgi:hypothetical protein